MLVVSRTLCFIGLFPKFLHEDLKRSLLLTIDCQNFVLHVSPPLPHPLIPTPLFHPCVAGYRLPTSYAPGGDWRPNSNIGQCVWGCGKLQHDYQCRRLIVENPTCDKSLC